ncbi:hypothetical protein D3C71_2002650 [compost metagenome]
MAKPAQKVAACCSAMPTSIMRSGKRAWNFSRPEPPGIAGVTATIRLSASASSIRVLPKTSVYMGGPEDFIT